MDQFIGKQIGNCRSSDRPARYEIKALLGKQTGRRTLLAEDSETKSLVVIKLMLFGPDFTWQDLKLFEREAETLKSLDHPAIPKYLDSFEIETQLGKGFALVQTYIEARSLQDWVSSGYTFSEDDLWAIASDILHILDYLHHRQPPVIHRDIKPSNILLQSQGRETASSLYLVDFGSVQTAASSGTITVVGTYGYMPPEQFGGRAQTASDLYGLGATLVYLATGQHPADLIQSDLQIAFEDVVTLSPFFTDWLRQITYADISKRIPSAKSALQRLANTASDLPIEALDLPAATDRVRARYKADFLLKRSRSRDIQVFSYPEEFAIHLSSGRLEESPVFSTYAAANRLLRYLEPAAQPIIFVFLGISFFNEDIAWHFATILIALLTSLCAVWALSVALCTKLVAIKLSAISTDQLRLSLSALHSGKARPACPTHQRTPRIDSQIETISACDHGLYYQVKFHFTSSQNAPPSLKIVGSLREIDWLCEHITHWRDIPIEYSGKLGHRRRNGLSSYQRSSPTYQS